LDETGSILLWVNSYVIFFIYRIVFVYVALFSSFLLTFFSCV
jgi:hypothetical protein